MNAVSGAQGHPLLTIQSRRRLSSLHSRRAPLHRLAPRHLARLGAGVAVTLVLAGMPTVARAAGWQTERVATPAGATQAQLNAVSCPTVSECVAVGGADRGDATGTASQPSPFAEIENGAAWTLSPLAPLGGTEPGLASVSCPTESFCVAAGSSHGGSGGAVGSPYPSGEPLIEMWNGMSWRSTTLSLAGGLSGGFQGVSCSSIRLCLAVGSARREGRQTVPIAATWQGRAWRPTTPRAEGHSGSSLDGVSCVSGRCLAVGEYTFDLGRYSPSGGPLVERWAAGRWSRETAPQYVAGSGGKSAPFKWATGLTSVSCASTSSCVAVGTADPPGNGLPEAFGEIWNGRGWRVNSTGLPHFIPGRGTVLAEFTGVDCASAHACLAVGETQPTTEHHVDTLLAARWNGHRFIRQPGLGTTEAYGLTGVSCPTALSCTVVGSRTSNGESTIIPLAESGSGRG